MAQHAPPFTVRGMRAGALGVAPLLPGVLLYGVAFGVMAGATGLSVAEAMLFSGLVYAGAAQMASLQAWGDPVPVLAVGLTTLAMNARYILLGAALRPWFAGLSPWQSYPSLFVMGDGNWAMALREREEGRQDAAFLIGSGAIMWLVWVSATAAGAIFGEVLGNPARYGVDFMLAAFFAALAVTFLRGPGSVLPFAIGAAVAVLSDRMLEGPWHILIGAGVGSLAGAFRHADAD
jgi:4-azaleucine resistance transporter AzlC